MAFPERLACLAIGANTRTLYAKEKKYAKHPATGQPVLVSPPVSVIFFGSRSLFIDASNVKTTSFATVRQFFDWLRSRGEVAKGEIVYSACLGGTFQPVADMGKDDVEKELRARMIVDAKAQIEGSDDEKRETLLELRRIAGEFVKEPTGFRPNPQPEAVAGSKEEERLTDGILEKFAAGRR